MCLYVGRWITCLISRLPAHRDGHGTVCWLLILLFRILQVRLYEIRAEYHVPAMYEEYRYMLYFKYKRVRTCNAHVYIHTYALSQFVEINGLFAFHCSLERRFNFFLSAVRVLEIISKTFSGINTEMK